MNYCPKLGKTVLISPNVGFVGDFRNMFLLELNIKVLAIL